MLFKVKEGKHIHLDGKVYLKGSVLNSDKEMDKVFRGKFERVHESAYAPPVEKKIIKKKVTKKKVKKKVSKKKAWAKGLGTSMTDEFPKAAKHDLHVFRRGSIYHVYEEGQKTPINGKGMRKSKVAAFIQEWLEE